MNEGLTGIKKTPRAAVNIQIKIVRKNPRTEKPGDGDDRKAAAEDDEGRQLTRYGDRPRVQGRIRKT